MNTNKNNGMKTYCKILFYALLAISGYACSDDDDALEPELKVNVEELIFKTDGGVKTIYVKANQQWSVASSEAWCTLTQKNGEAGTVGLEVSAAENTSTDARTAIITVTSGSLTQQVKIIQAQKDLLTLVKNRYEVAAQGESIVVDLQITGDYTINIKNEWIKEIASKTVSESKKTFVVAANQAVELREGTIDFSLGNITETVTIIQAGASQTAPADKTGMNNDAVVLAQKMKLGWNLGNSLEATGTTSASEIMWGNAKTTKKMIDAVKAAGFNTVRIPCAWNAYIVDQTTFKINDTWLARVKEVVDYCVDNEMYAILNMHWDGGWRDENPYYDKQEAINKKHKALWQQIAIYFRNYDEHLLFAGTNEVHAGYDTPSVENIAVQLSFNQVFIDAVRATGGRNTWRNLIVQAYNTNIDLAVAHLKMPTDITANRVMAEVHYYDPYEFTLREENSVFLWGKDFTGNGTTSWGQEAWADAQFNKMKINFVDKGIPVILGEYAATLRTSLSAIDYANHIKARNYYLNYVTNAAIENGMIPVYWDSGHTGNNGSGLFDRATGNQVHADAIQAIVSVNN